MQGQVEVLGHHFLSNAEASVFGILVVLDNLVSLLLNNLIFQVRLQQVKLCTWVAL